MRRHGETSRRYTRSKPPPPRSTKSFFREMTPGMVSVFTTLLGSTADTCSASVYEAFFEEFTLSFVKGGLSDPEVDPRPSDCKLWSLRSCSPSLFVDFSVMARRLIPMVVEFLQLQYIDKMFDVRCAGPASSGSGRENTVEFPPLQPVFWTWSFTRPLCATTDAHGRCPLAVHRLRWTSLCCRSDQFQLSASTAGMKGRFF